MYGFDGGKQVKGRRRHIVVDTQGLGVGILVTEANASERLGALVILDESREKLGQLQKLWVDGGYCGIKFHQAVQRICGPQVEVEVVKRQSKEFKALPQRWIVERTFGWLNRFRRLSKDYELHSEVSEGMIYGALLKVMLKRLAVS